MIQVGAFPGSELRMLCRQAFWEGCLRSSVGFLATRLRSEGPPLKLALDKRALEQKDVSLNPKPLVVLNNH